MSERLPNPYEDHGRSRKGNSKKKAQARELRIQKMREELGKRVIDERAAGSVGRFAVRVSRKPHAEHRELLDEISAKMNRFHERGLLRRKQGGAYALTVFDTKQHSLVHLADPNVEELEDAIYEDYPQLFMPTNPVVTDGLGSFGNRRFADRDIAVGISFSGKNKAILGEHQKMQGIIAPAGFTPQDRGHEHHMSLVTIRKEARTPGVIDVMKDPTFVPVFNVLETLAPIAVKFEPAMVQVQTIRPRHNA